MLSQCSKKNSCFHLFPYRVKQFSNCYRTGNHCQLLSAKDVTHVPHNKTLINEQYGLSIWCSNDSSIKICFANLILFMPIEELRDFMRCLYNATAVEKTGSEKDISVFITPTPLANMQLAFTPKEQRYLLGLCQRSILLAEQMILAN